MFTFKQFKIDDTHCAMKVGTDGVLLGAWAPVAHAKQVLDLGCGSGLIALMAAQRNLHAQVTGVEIEAEAVRDACLNVAASPFADRIRIVQADVRQWVAPEGCFDCILANPPYHEEDLLPPSAIRATARHTSGGGLNFAALLQAASRLLSPTPPEACLAVVLPAAAVPRFVPLAGTFGLFVRHRTEVVTRPGKAAKRILLSLSRQAAPPICDELVLLAPDGSRSAQYAALCRDFYLR